MKIGEFNELRINRMVDFGAYLIDDDTHEVLLPKRYLTPEMKVGDPIRVFVYNDSENRPVATTEQPKAIVGDFALMRVKAVNKVGAFLDWGLSAKDLLVPFSEQRVDMQAGRSYIVRVYLDEASHRIVASAKLAKFLNHTDPITTIARKWRCLSCSAVTWDTVSSSITPIGVRFTKTRLIRM